MEENNKNETNKDSSGSEGLLYGADPYEEVKESGNSLAYGAESQSQQTVPVQLGKLSESGNQDMAPVQLGKPSESDHRDAVPVQLSKSPNIDSQTAQSSPAQFYQTEISRPMGQNPYTQQVDGNLANQNPMGFGPIQVPPPIQGVPEAKPKKKKTGLVAGVLCAAAVVIAIAAGGLFFKSLLGGGDPRAQLAKGMANMAQEMAAYQGAVAEDIDFTALNQLKDTSPIHTRIDMSFTDPSSTGSIDNIAVALDGVTDYQNEMAEYGVSVGAFGFKMNVGSIVAADNTLYLSAPLVFQKEVYSLELTNLGRDFNDSAWSDLLYETLPEDYSLTLFGDDAASDDSEGTLVVSELEKIFGRQGVSLAESMTFEEIGQKRAFAFDGTAAEYGGVQVTMDKDAYNEAIEAMKDDILASDYYTDMMKGYETAYGSDFDEFKAEMDNVIEQIFGIRYEQDVVIDFYLDKKGRIVNISTPQDIAVSSEYSDVDSFAIDINFSGQERALDSIEGGIYMQSGDEILFMEISRKAGITDEYYDEDLTLRIQESSSDDEITFWYTNQWGYQDRTFDLQMLLEVPDGSIEIRADGAFTDIVKGERYTFELNHGAITIDGEDLLLMTGSITTEPTENTVEVPENATNIFEMSSEEINSLLYDILY
ncbi:MAG: hypothetical protein K2K74_11315 [Lachnospiraceae bacterium]|nr:hypothetical protein [Lachnospiraceae bacterium]